MFEGVDRCGKTTQTQRAIDHLRERNIPAALWRFPDRTTGIGRVIDRYLKSDAELDDACAHLLFSANRWEKRAELVATLAAGTTVVADRYALSGVAFTAAKNGPGRDVDWCRTPDAGLPAPDGVIFLDVDEETAASRGGFGRERYEQRDFQREVAACFRTLRPLTEASGVTWAQIDAGRSVEAVAVDVCSETDRIVARVAGGDGALRRLLDGRAYEREEEVGQGG